MSDDGTGPPLHVAHVLDSVHPSAGGLPSVVLNLAAAQAAGGARVTVFARDAPHAAADDDRARAERAGVRLEPVAGRAGGLPPLRPPSVLVEAARGAGLFHLHGVWDPVLLAAGAAARRTGTPYVLTPHGMLDPWSLAQKSVKKRLALWTTHRGLLRGCVFLHALNRDEADLFRPLGLRPPVEIIPNGVPGSLPDAEPGPPAGSRPPVVLFLGRLHPKKGLDTLVEAFAAVRAGHPRAKLVIAGPDGGAGGALRDAVARDGLRDAVELVGPVYGAAKYDLLRSARCFVLPSRQEGFSVAVLEALACGTPVVLSPACHFLEVAAHGAGRVVGGNAPEVAAAVLSLLGDPAAATAAGNAGRTLVRDRFTWEAVAAAMILAYRSAGV